MKKYIKPQIETKKFDVTDIISTSSIFSGLADLDKSSGVEWDDKILDPKDSF